MNKEELIIEFNKQKNLIAFTLKGESIVEDFKDVKKELIEWLLKKEIYNHEDATNEHFKTFIAEYGANLFKLHGKVWSVFLNVDNLNNQ